MQESKQSRETFHFKLLNMKLHFGCCCCCRIFVVRLQRMLQQQQQLLFATMLLTLVFFFITHYVNQNKSISHVLAVCLCDWPTISQEMLFVQTLRAQLPYDLCSNCFKMYDMLILIILREEINNLHLIFVFSSFLLIQRKTQQIETKTLTRTYHRQLEQIRLQYTFSFEQQNKSI